MEDVRVIGHGEIAIDSGAAESVWPAGFMDDNIPTKPVDEDKSNTVYVAANGSRMRNMGMKKKSSSEAARAEAFRSQMSKSR